jgi:hypothetical protein
VSLLNNHYWQTKMLSQTEDLIEQQSKLLAT